jgi:LEA14-like dessication related protein
MALQSKLTVYAAIAGVFALMGGIIFYASLDNVELEQVEIKLANVELININTTGDQAKFEVTFLIKNPSDKTLSVPVIDYQLYGDDMLLGSGLYSTADVALPGRALFYSGAEIPLKNIFVLNKDDVSPEIYEKAVNEKIDDFKSEGRITTQTSWSEVDKDFKTSYNKKWA